MIAAVSWLLAGHSHHVGNRCSRSAKKCAPNLLTSQKIFFNLRSLLRNQFLPPTHLTSQCLTPTTGLSDKQLHALCCAPSYERASEGTAAGGFFSISFIIMHQKQETLSQCSCSVSLLLSMQYHVVSKHFPYLS